MDVNGDLAQEMEDFLFLNMLFIIILQLDYSRRWINRIHYVRPMNQHRGELGYYYTFWQELKQDESMFRRVVRMNLETFNILLNAVGPRIEHIHPRAECAESRLALTLQYLASGDEILSIANAYRVGESTARGFIKEVCIEIFNALHYEYLKLPNTEEWKDIMQQYLQNCNMPHCCGAIDGKHCKIQCPANSGSDFYNFKGFYSISVMGICDSDYVFTAVHVGEPGKNSDGGIFNTSRLGIEIQDRGLNLPKGTCNLPGTNIPSECFFVGDDAFPLLPMLMKPYCGNFLDEPKQIFNYRLSRARRTIENTFGIWSARWRVLKKAIAMQEDTADEIIWATICLHNFLRKRELLLNPADRAYCPPNFVDQQDENGNIIPGLWRNDAEQLPDIYQPNRVVANRASEMRETLKDYFQTPAGKVPWQLDMIRPNINFRV